MGKSFRKDNSDGFKKIKKFSKEKKNRKNNKLKLVDYIKENKN